MSLDNTPNVVIKNPDIRFWITAVVFAVSLLTAIAALFFNFFPEVANGTDIPTRAIAFINAVVSLLTGAFGLTVSLPNVPRNVGQ